MVKANQLGRPLIVGSLNWLKKNNKDEINQMNQQISQIDSRVSILSVAGASNKKMNISG